VIILIPPAIKGGAAVVAGAGAVAKGVHKYFQIKKTRAQTRQADAGAASPMRARGRSESARGGRESPASRR